mmetsp:Transcript_11823/g.18834  ORF Transcript_11823/g.18834 Transcript_11823/m.18834 type:complete len:110 (-) Transcript_11823:1721-2050(-)
MTNNLLILHKRKGFAFVLKKVFCLFLFFGLDEKEQLVLLPTQLAQSPLTRQTPQGAFNYAPPCLMLDIFKRILLTAQQTVDRLHRAHLILHHRAFSILVCRAGEYALLK